MKQKLESIIGLISHISVALDNMYDCGDINRAFDNVGENIKISAKHSLGRFKQKQCNPWFDDEFLVRIMVGLNLNFYNFILSVCSICVQLLVLLQAVITCCDVRSATQKFPKFECREVIGFSTD
jgi:hypothetical protein